MTLSSPGASAEVGRTSNRRIVLVLLAVLVLGFLYYLVRMITYDPNYVTKVDQPNRLVLQSGEGVVLIGVDCPPAEDQGLGASAAEFVNTCLLNRHIRVEKGEEPKDAAGWILGYVFVNKDGREIFMNEELLRRGFARVQLAFPNLKYRARFEAAESEAKTKRIGVWSVDYKPPGS